MSRRLVRFRDVARRLGGPAVVAAFALVGPALREAGSAESKPAAVATSKADPRLVGYQAPRGFRIRVVAAEPAVVDPAAMAFDDQGRLFVAEWRPADRAFETSDSLALPEGGSARVRRARKSSTDVVKRLVDADGDGVYESSEVVLDGCELPTAILPWRNSLYLTCVGRLERWSDDDGDGRFESRTILADGFAAGDRRGLSGMTLGADGWLYLTSGDDDNRVVGADGSRVDLSRTGGVFRCRPDGSRMTPFAIGLRNPYKGLAFDASFAPFLVDGDQDDGSKFQGGRLVNPVEEGDYGWRVRPGPSGGLPDFDRAAVDGERPGKLPAVARVGRGAPSGLAISNGVAFPEALRGTLIEPDPARRVVRGFKVEPSGGSYALKGETTLMAAADDQFRPVQAVVGADGAIYVLDRRGGPPDPARPGGEGKAGRLYRLTWEGEGTSPALPLKPNNWRRILEATSDQLTYQYLTSPDHPEADRALRELLDRGSTPLVPCLAWASNASASLHCRLLGIQGARQLWCEQVETAMLTLLKDPSPEVRRLAAQSLAWEPKAATPRLVPKLMPHLDDADGRVVREVALAIGRHAEPRPQQTSAALLRWIYAHPQADPTVRDAFIRALERLGEAGVEEVALAIRTRRGVERETAVALFGAFRVAPAAERLDGLVKIPDLAAFERLALIRQYQSIPHETPVPTQGLAEWILRHAEADPAVKLAALDACRLAGNPASTLVLALLDDEDESVRLAAARVAARSRPPGAIERLTGRLSSKTATAAERIGIIRALGQAGPGAFSAIDAAYLASDDPTTRRASLRSMVESDPSKSIPALESALAGPDTALRKLAVQILGEAPKTSPILGRATLNRTLTRDDLPAVLAALRKLDDAEGRKLLAAVEEEGATGSIAIGPAEVRAKLNQAGDPWAGLGVFSRESSRCSTCHSVGGRGASFGPSLAIGPASPSVDRLIESILMPSKEVAARFAAARVKLKDGRSFRGIVATRDSRSLALREPDGREVRIAPERVESESADPGSAMPEHVALGLTTQDLADVVAFLRSKPAQASLAHGPTRLDRVLAIGPFAPGADRLRIPLDRVEPARLLPGPYGASATWSAQEANPWGVFNLRGSLGARGGHAYIAAQVKSPVDQSAALRFGVEGATRIYLNGVKVAEAVEHDAPGLDIAFLRPPSNTLAPLPDLARLPLKTGWNLLIIAVDRPEGPDGDLRASFEIASPEPIEIRTPKN